MRMNGPRLGGRVVESGSKAGAKIRCVDEARFLEPFAFSAQRASANEQTTAQYTMVSTRQQVQSEQARANMRIADLLFGRPVRPPAQAHGQVIASNAKFRSGAGGRPGTRPPSDGGANNHRNGAGRRRDRGINKRLPHG